jgi:hypothetical protein
MINDVQFTVIWYVDDIKMSHHSEKVVDAEIAWLESIYGSLLGGKGDEHTYLGMDLKFNNRKVEVTMIPYLQENVNKFPYELEKLATSPAVPYLFEVSDTSKLLSVEQQKAFHRTVANMLWAAICARPDLLTALSFLTCRVKEPDQDNLKKLVRMANYIQSTMKLPLRSSMDGSSIVKWWVDASFASRNTMKNQSGATMSMGKGSIYSMSRKLKLNTTSSTDAKLVGA